MKKLLLPFLLLIATQIQAQTNEFSVIVEPYEIPNVGGLQSFAHGQHDGKWLIIGGRLDGLHRRQPFASFDVAGNNNQLIVIDPVSKQKWTAPLSSLSVDLQEQLSSTNMEYHQEGNYLYLIGGYGYNTATAARKTFEFMTAIDVPNLMNAIISNQPITTYFRQITNPIFAVTGGHLKKINHTYYLAGGNRFDGNYNPMGNATYTQVYTNSVQKFNILDDGTNLSIQTLPSHTDATLLHRRDYNCVSQILPSGEEAITLFSGVFQTTVNLPFLNAVSVDSTSYAVENNFQQFYNHYHCAVLPLYDESNQEMHTIFFGGIAQYYDSLGILVQDNNVPFVKTIAKVTRNANGQMAEYKLPVELPNFLGAGAEFFISPEVPIFNNDVVKLNQLTADTNFVGYIYGGINSTAKNIFTINTGAESSASSQLFKVYIVKNALALPELNENSNSPLKMLVFPNPNDGRFSVNFNLTKIEKTTLTITDVNGKIIEKTDLKGLKIGENEIERKIHGRQLSNLFFVTLESGNQKLTQKVILSND